MIPCPTISSSTTSPYIDTTKFLADSIFIENKIKVRFKLTMYKDGEYCIIFCRVRKSAEAVFLKCLEQLENKMLILGNTDYPAFCEKFFADIEAQAN